MPPNAVLGAQIAVSLANHARDLPDLAHAVKYAVVPDATKDNLTATWKAWIEQAGVVSRLFLALLRGVQQCSAPAGYQAYMSLMQLVLIADAKCCVMMCFGAKQKRLECVHCRVVAWTL